MSPDSIHLTAEETKLTEFLGLSFSMSQSCKAWESSITCLPSIAFICCQSCSWILRKEKWSIHVGQVGHFNVLVIQYLCCDSMVVLENLFASNSMVWWIGAPTWLPDYMDSSLTLPTSGYAISVCHYLYLWNSLSTHSVVRVLCPVGVPCHCYYRRWRVFSWDLLLFPCLKS